MAAMDVGEPILQVDSATVRAGRHVGRDEGSGDGCFLIAERGKLVRCAHGRCEQSSFGVVCDQRRQPDRCTWCRA
jgi:hypothetical protein